MAKSRRERGNINSNEYDLLKPIDVLALGGDDDPCFGKYHDFVAKECQICGDNEFCQIAKMEYLKNKRTETELEQKFKDVEESNKIFQNKVKSAKDLINELKLQGLKKFKIILQVSNEIKLPKETVKDLYLNNN